MLMNSLNYRSLLFSLLLFLGLSGFTTAQTDSLASPGSGPVVGGPTVLAHPGCQATPRFLIRDAESVRLVLQSPNQVPQAVRRLTNLLKDKAQFKANRICSLKNCQTGDCEARLVHQEINVQKCRKIVHGQTILYLTVQGKFWFKCGCN